MSQDNGKPLDVLELASLPPDDPLRRRHEASLEGEALRSWEQETALSDQLRAALPEVPVPQGLEAGLLAVASEPAEASTLEEPSIKPRPRAGLLDLQLSGRMAAGLLILAGLAAALVIYFTVFHQPARLQPLNADLVQSVAELAVQNRQAPLEVASTDENTVQKALAAHRLDFPVLMLKPSSGTLLGGGVCDFGGTKAAFTQWKAENQTYTLYEFNGKDLSVPAEFRATTGEPTKMWTDTEHYAVYLFPGTGGKCCWALVMDSGSAPNIFAQYGAAY